MSIKIGSKQYFLNDGTPLLWNSDTRTVFDNSDQTKITADDGAGSDYFGYKVAVGYGRIVVGAYGDDDDGLTSGSAYIFDLDGTQLAKITASDGAGGDYFGRSVAVGNGRIVVGAYRDDKNDDVTNVGSAYIFDLDGTQLAKITPSDGAADDYFGFSVAVGNGRIVVGAKNVDYDGATNAGAAYIFDLEGNQLAKITSDNVAGSDAFGHSVAIGNGRIVVGAYLDDDIATNSGSAYIFDLEGNQLAKITASDPYRSDYFGRSVSIGSGRIVVGANRNDNPTNSGSAYIFDLEGNQLAKITADDAEAYDYFGEDVAVGSGRIVVGAYLEDAGGSSSGSAYIFDLDGTQLAKITASDAAATDYFGLSVAVGCGRIVVGSYADDDNGTSSGSAYIYKTPPCYTIYDAIELQKGLL